MRIALIVMADVLVLVVALLAVTEYHALKRYSSFTVPLTDRLIACGAVKAEDRERLLREDRIVHIVGIVLSLAVWLMLTLFFAGVSGAIIFPAGVLALLAALRPSMEENAENREQYYRAHRKDIDAMKYHEYITKQSSEQSEGGQI